MLGGRAHYAAELPAYISHHALASQQMAGGERGGAWVRQGRGGLAGTVAGGLVGELLLAPLLLLLLLQPRVGAAAAARHAGRHADALSPHHHGALLVGVLLLLLLLPRPACDETAVLNHPGGTQSRGVAAHLPVNPGVRGVIRRFGCHPARRPSEVVFCGRG